MQEKRENTTAITFVNLIADKLNENYNKND